MENLDFLFYRGSSPTLELVLPLALAPSDKAVLSLSQDSRTVLEYTLNLSQHPSAEGSLVRDEAEASCLLLHMTQSDTLALEAGDCELQLRIKTADGADTFQPLHGRVGPCRREGVLP